MNSEPLDLIPLWCFFLMTLVIGMFAVEAGYRIGRRRHARSAEEKDAPVAAMVGSILGLLAFMLAFTFSMAATRFDARRQAVLQEANAIGTTWLRARLLPEPERTEIMELLRRYTELRVQKIDADRITALMAESEELHEQLWSRAVAAAGKDATSIMTGLFLQSLNESIDLHSTRVFAGLLSRIPLTIWLALFSLDVLGMASVGYQAGLSATRRSPEMLILTLAFATVLYLNVDLDRAHEGLLHVSQQPMINLYDTMQAAQPR